MQKYILIFANVLFRILYSGDRMKRESGANPGQSRCCEFHVWGIILMPLFCKKNGKAIHRKRVRRPAKQSRKIVRSRKAGSAQNVLR